MTVFIAASKLRSNCHQYKLIGDLQFQGFGLQRLDANTQQTFDLDDG
jgi:hypothetical protein